MIGMWFLCFLLTCDSILNQIFRPIQRLPQCLKGVRIIAFAFFLDGRIPKSEDRGAQALNSSKDRIWLQLASVHDSKRLRLSASGAGIISA
jgi:hypothetical protein